VGGIFFGLSSIAEKNYVLFSSTSLFLNYFLSLLLMIFPIFALVNFSVFLSVLINNNLMAIVTNFCLHFVFYLMVQLEICPEIFLVNYLRYPLEIFLKMARGITNVTWSPEVWNMILITLLYSIAFLWLSIQIFKRKEIK